MESKILDKKRLPITSLHEFQGDFKTLGKKQFEKLKKSIQKNGFIQPFFIWKSGDKYFILDGHQRKKAIIDLYGDTIDVDCLEIKADSELEAKKFVLYYSTSYAEFDKDSFFNFADGLTFDDLSAFQFPNFSFSENDFLKGLDNDQDDEIPEVSQNELGVQLGDIYTLGDHRLMCGDCTSLEDINKLIERKKISLCFTSPPYSDMRDYRGNLNLDPQHLSKFMMAMCEIYVVNLGLQRKNGEIFPYWDAYINQAKQFGLKFLSWNVWDKKESGSIGNQTAIFPLEHEWIFVFGNKKEINRTVPSTWGGISKTSMRSKRQKDGSLENLPGAESVNQYKKMGTVYRASPEKARNFDFDHPAMFPVHFPESFILACTQSNENVYEPFGGSGSTLIACEKTKRKCYMMELDPHYCSVIIKRWEKYTGKKAVKCE